MRLTRLRRDGSDERRRNRNLFGWLTRLGLIATLSALCLGALGGAWWFLDLFSHFRLQYGFALAVLAVAAAVQRLRWQAVIATGGLVLVLGSIGRYYLPSSDQCETDTARTLLSFNVYTANTEKARVARFIRESGADIVALFEVDIDWLRELAILEDRYPYSLLEPRSDNFGIALFSAHPIAGEQTHFFGTAGVPSIEASVSFPEGTVTLLATHPLPPVSAENARMRDNQIADLADYVANHVSTPLILAGDLNATPWSAAFRQLTKNGLSDARSGHGISPTWMRTLPWIAIPIDHVLTTEAITVTDHQVIPAMGSDHNGILVRFCIAPTSP